MGGPQPGKRRNGVDINDSIGALSQGLRQDFLNFLPSSAAGSSTDVATSDDALGRGLPG